MLGSILATLSGLTLFWGYRRNRLAAQAAMVAEVQATAPVNDDVMVAETAVQVDDDEVPAMDQLVGPPGSPPVVAASPRPPVDAASLLDRVPFLLFVSWWGVLNLVGYTLAGEKMPWLGIHLTLPLILLTGWYFGRVFDRIDWARFRSGGWVYVVLFPLLFVTLFQVLSPFVIGQGPFAGLQQAQLSQSGEWLAVVAVSILVIGAIFLQWRHTGGATSARYVRGGGLRLPEFVNRAVGADGLVYQL